MVKTNIRLSAGIMFLLILLIFVPSVAAQSFEPVFKKINQFQRGDEIEIKVRVSSDSFTFLRSKSTEIDRGEFERLLKDKASQSRHQLKVLSDGGLVLKIEVSNLLRLEETYRGDSPIAWEKIDFVPVGSYPLKVWPNFIKQAISHGLMEYELMEYEGQTFAFLTFKQIDPAGIKFGKQSLKFTDNFYKYMKISNEFKSMAGNTDKFAILVHEPHWLLAGQYKLIPGLKALLDANPKYKFRFLVEGYWEKDIKNIPTKPLLNRFSKNISSSTQVHSLLNKFLIDGPLAYRLLYAPDLPAVAIDNPELIRQTPREPDLANNWPKQEEIFKKIIEKIKKLPQEQTTSVNETFNILRYYVYVDVHDLKVKGQAAIDYYGYVAKLYDGLSNKLESLSKKDFTIENSFLKGQADGCRVEAKILEIALKRDGTMANNIQGHFNSEYTDRIPLVFIGNFHTPGIIDKLSKEIGYVVIEPRITPLSIVPPQRERDDFNGALKPESRLNYLKKLSGGLKLNVAPLEKELTYYQSYLERETPKIESQRNAFKTSSPLGPDISSRIINAINQNPSLSNAMITFGGGDQAPPPPIQGAFASFSYGPEGRNSQMLFYDKTEANWKRKDRLNYLEAVLFILPHESVQKKTRKVTFYQDKETNRTYFWVFDPTNQTFFSYEWKEGMDIFILLPLPKKETLYLKLSIREMMLFEKGKRHG